MKLLRDSFLLGALRQWWAARRPAAQRAYVVTVPAPRPKPSANVVELRPRAEEPPRSAGVRTERATAPDARVVNL